MKSTINPETGNIDLTGLSQAQLDLLYLKLDQTAPQTTVGTFAFPKVEFPSASVAPLDAVLMLHGDADSPIVDSSTSAKTVTTVGNVTASAVQSKFGGKSLLFGGTTSDYLTVADSDDWTFGSGDFTIDFWVNFTNLTGTQSICGQKQDSSVGWAIIRQGTTGEWDLFFTDAGGGDAGWYYFTPSTPIAVGEWHHFAFERTTTTAKIFLDGQSQTLSHYGEFGSGTLPNVAARLAIGAARPENTGTVTTPLKGYLDELRITKGTARWTSNFTPPTSAYVGANYYSTLAAGTQTANADYLLPPALPASNKILQSDNTGQLSWITPPSVSFGTTTQIPYMNAGGTDFLYSANLTFDGTTLTVGGSGNFTKAGAYGTTTTLIDYVDLAGYGLSVPRIKFVDSTGAESYGIIDGGMNLRTDDFGIDPILSFINHDFSISGYFSIIFSGSDTHLTWNPNTTTSIFTIGGKIRNSTLTGSKMVLTNATKDLISGLTFPTTATANQLLYCSSTTAVSGLATANDGILVTSHLGVPSILSGTSNGGQFLLGVTNLPPAYSGANLTWASGLLKIISTGEQLRTAYSASIYTSFFTDSTGTVTISALGGATGDIVFTPTGTAASLSMLASVGKITLGGYGGTNNETLLWDFETTANVVGLSSASGVTKIALTSLDLDMSANDWITDTTTGSKFGTGATQKLGFWGLTPAVQPSAYTQTYSTASKTLPAQTSADLSTTATTQVAPYGFATQAQGDAIATQVNALRVDLDNAKKVINQMIDDLQLIGILS